MRSHRVEHRTGRDKRLSCGAFGRVAVGGASWQRGHAGDKGFVFGTPLDHDPIFERLRH